jgi:hypothetical protein
MLIDLDPSAVVRLACLLEGEGDVAKRTPVTDVEQAGFGLFYEFRYKK